MGTCREGCDSGLDCHVFRRGEEQKGEEEEEETLVLWVSFCVQVVPTALTLHDEGRRGGGLGLESVPSGRGMCQQQGVTLGRLLDPKLGNDCQTNGAHTEGAVTFP